MSRDSRLLVLDECVPRRAAGELLARGRETKTVAGLALCAFKDSDLIATLTKTVPTPWVLVTADNKILRDHPEAIARYQPTLAIIAPYTGRDGFDDHWRRDTLHRWAHHMGALGDGVACRYTPSSVRRVTPT